MPGKPKEKKELHRKMKRLYRVFAGAFSALVLGVLTSSLYFKAVLPDQLYLPGGQSLSELEQSVQQVSAASMSVVVKDRTSSPYRAGVRMFGAVPVKEILVQVVPREYVVPGGMPFGIKMFTDGVMVVGLTDLLSEDGTVNPAREAGIQLGDVIMRIDGKKVSTNEEVAELISQSEGDPVKLLIRREDQELLTISLTPEQGSDGGIYRAGMWVRDSSAGIGTLTYLDPESGIFAGLGHGVCDVDTGTLMPLYSGEAVNVAITGVTKGESGSPGELRGTFSQEAPIGTLVKNEATGIYGQMDGIPDILSQGGEPVAVAMRQEVHTGKAVIRTTISGDTPVEYEISIERVSLSEQNPTRNMVIRITDPRLLSATGGIVQGMSGSPILQNGKLVGAVTHVLVNDPTRGYGILIENMLETAQ